MMSTYADGGTHMMTEVTALEERVETLETLLLELIFALQQEGYIDVGEGNSAPVEGG